MGREVFLIVFFVLSVVLLTGMYVETERVNEVSDMYIDLIVEKRCGK